MASLGVLQGREKGNGGELAALIRVHDCRSTMPSKGFAQRLQARRCLQRHREPLREHLAAEPVDNHHQIQTAKRKNRDPPQDQGPHRVRLDPRESLNLQILLYNSRWNLGGQYVAIFLTGQFWP